MTDLPTPNTETHYHVMDGRARFDTDRAAVLSVADTLDEAMSDRKMFGGDSVITKVTSVGREIVKREVLDV